MLKMPEFLKYPEWYIENEKFMNEIGKNDKRYTIKRDAPDFIKKSYDEYLKDILKNNNRNKTIISE
ncbi:hypothetical protein [Anaerococcus obesiensis]|uniref:hypothetical protein n=1 Tax=Anaerococcus obesiensis TaxID=1287640 RepID=UPI003991DBEA